MTVNARHIGLIGDVHGQYNHASLAIQMLAEDDVHDLHFLGDFGFVWDGSKAEHSTLDALAHTLGDHDSIAHVTGGNHENFDLLLAIEPDSEGIRWIRHNIALLPRGWRWTAPSGTTIASLGGANSIDRYARKPRQSWWPQEQITDADLAALGSEPVDVLLGHDSPRTMALAVMLRPSDSSWAPRSLEYAHISQAQFHRGFLAVKPKLAVGGHYHMFVDTSEEFVGADGTEFTSRVVVLNESRAARYIAMLDTDTLDLTILPRTAHR